jgi:high-affinity iron transporter
MAAQAVLFLQNGGYIDVMTDTIWDTSWLLKEDSISGRLLHTLVGYVQAPDGAQILAYLATIAAILVLTRLTGNPVSRPRQQPAE